MNLALSLILLAILGFTLGIAFYYYKFAAIITIQQGQIEELMLSTKGGESLQAPKLQMRIAVEVLEPIRLAKQKSALARLIADSAPNFIRQKVYHKVAKEIKDELKERNLDAKVGIIHI